jgi:hypothetical protein
MLKPIRRVFYEAAVRAALFIGSNEKRAGNACRKIVYMPVQGCKLLHESMGACL